MSALQYTLNDYILYIFASHKRRLLVEGSDDFRLFSRLIYTFSKESNQIEIDDASSLIGFDHPISNREKVEMVCELVKGKSFSNKLTGFVDREFREFTLEPNLGDSLKAHRVDSRLVWTRGHSVENYYFEFENLCDPISTLSTARYHRFALNIFERNFERIIRMACVSSLLGLEVGNYQIIRNNISWKIFDVNEDIINLNLNAFEQALRAKDVREEFIQLITSRYSYWEELVNKAEFDIVRWLCHGHIGLTFIWSTYKRLIYEVSRDQGNPRPEREVERAIDTKEEIRFNACAQKWIERSLGNDCVFPYEILKLLEITR